MAGSVIADKYEVVRKIGHGGMGVVYEAIHSTTRRRVAVKMLKVEAGGSSGTDHRARFEREVIALGALESTNIAQVLDAGEDPDTQAPFMVMELISGKTVASHLKVLGPLRTDLALCIAAEACLGLSAAHRAGFIHRDIKPSNLALAEQDRGKLVVKVLDFGVAKHTLADFEKKTDGGLTRTGSVVGSPHYMSPEQAQGLKTIDHRSDIWSLGVVLYKMLTGRTPFDHLETLGQVIIGIWAEPARPVQDLAPWVSPEAAAIVHHALQRRPERRFQSAEAMYEAIAELLPDGHDIDKSMLTPLSEDERAFVAPRAPETPSAADHSGANPALKELPADPVTVHTTAGVITSASAGSRARKRRWPWVFAGAVGVAAGAYGFSLLKGRTSQDASRESPTTTTVTSPMPTAATSERQTAAAERSVELSVAPSGVQVDVDGRSVTVTDGKVVLTGPLGKLFNVRLSARERELTKEIAITENGALPPSITLPERSAAAASPRKVGASAPSRAAPTAPRKSTSTDPKIDKDWE